MRTVFLIPRAGILLLAILAPGCSSGPPDDRLEALARESLARQAEQNRAIARQAQEVAEASRQLVEADAKARQELIAAQERLQSEIQSERRSLDRQRDDMEQERRDLARERLWDPLLSSAVVQASLLLVIALPLLIVVFLLRAVRTEDRDEALGQMLVQEFAAEEPTLIAGNWTVPEERPPAALLEQDPPEPVPDSHGQGRVPTDGEEPA